MLGKDQLYFFRNVGREGFARSKKGADRSDSITLDLADAVFYIEIGA